MAEYDYPSEVHKEALDLRAHPEGSQSRLEISNISIEHFLMSTCQQCLEKCSGLSCRCNKVKPG